MKSIAPVTGSTAANNCPVMWLFQFPILTIIVLTLASVGKGNDIQTHEVGSLGLLMTPSFGILFFACVYSALSYSCILHNKIIYPNTVFCLLVLHGYAREEKGGKSFFLCAACSPSSLSCLVSAEALPKERQGSQRPSVATEHMKKELWFSLFVLICIAWVSEDQYDSTTLLKTTVWLQT